MARSTYIYVVTLHEELVSAFTVKHELATWLSRNKGDYRIWRIADGLYQKRGPTEMTDEFDN